MSIVNNAEKKELNLSKFNIDSIKNIIKFIIEKHNDLNKHDQYALFLEMSEIPLLKNEFFDYRDKALNVLRKKFDQDNIRMDYHVTTNLPNIHLKVLNALTEEFFYWKSRFDTEKDKQYPNDYLLKMFAEMMNHTAILVSKFNLGTPVMVWVQRRAKLMQNNNKTVSIKSFGAELNINKYNTDSTKQDPLVNGDNNRAANSTTKSSTVTKIEQQRGQDGGSVRIPGTGQGQHIQTSSSIPANEGRTERSQAGDDRRETEELF